MHKNKLSTKKKQDKKPSICSIIVNGQLALCL